ncbi:medium chain dehydrogenase/reductase family protein [Streptomonospora wellingtoniae]|uniref:Medium chain dehydrogenase/reductase family protein n=1 Tax=Streptomonospora wellingtoniae TaxID=3075544 RepID=A0ABU2KRP1_9ACTN|nr:medium chain dehydrogenase/reductase family protein [Streptomonospora sp. DSM 45055]MDT0301955.1 medium chain dehydrogenase/reductase family protein [Streptomonospora sp. DSM 45055]
MKAAILPEFGAQLSVRSVPGPTLGTGEVVVDVVAAPVLPYAAEVFSGARQYLLRLPAAPGAGAVGRVREVGPDATRLSPGDWVLCDPTVRSRDDALTPDITLQGLSARGEGGLRLQERFGHGAFAEQMLVPTENAAPLGTIDPADAGRWAVLNLCLVPYGGLLAAGVQPGETVLVSGATGNFGSAGVAVALAMGAGCVVAPGRDRAVLDDLKRRFGFRVRPVELTSAEDADRERMVQAAPGPIDAVLDLLPPSAGTRPVRAAAMAVREHGRVVLMGGVGMLGGADLELPYPWIMRNSVTVRGQWMYPRSAVGGLIALARAGLLDLSGFEITRFALDDAARAVAHAADCGRRFALTVLRP